VQAVIILLKVDSTEILKVKTTTHNACVASFVDVLWEIKYAKFKVYQDTKSVYKLKFLKSKKYFIEEDFIN
jgi:hypothetical protein